MEKQKKETQANGQLSFAFDNKTYQFHPSNGTVDCTQCDLYATDWCDEAPCLPRERNDGKKGIFILK